jgi:antitoxin component YwqK of YwqJK toxin-antitoxin module
MMKQKRYADGQKTHEQNGDQLTYFFKNGEIKAFGESVNETMQGEWKFYRESGQLWQVGNFKDNQKHGRWVRYDKADRLEYEAYFDRGKMLKK